MALIQYEWHPVRGDLDTCRHPEGVCLEGGPCEDAVRGWPSTREGERPQKNPALPTPCSWTSSLETCKKTSFCCLNHLVVVLCYGSPRKLIQVSIAMINLLSSSSKNPYLAI